MMTVLHARISFYVAHKMRLCDTFIYFYKELVAAHFVYFGHFAKKQFLHFVNLSWTGI